MLERVPFAEIPASRYAQFVEAPVLNELRLAGAVRDIRRRVDRAVDEFTDDQRNPIVDEPGHVSQLLARRVLTVALRGSA